MLGAAAGGVLGVAAGVVAAVLPELAHADAPNMVAAAITATHALPANNDERIVSSFQ